jgi:hypothetical protein
MSTLDLAEFDRMRTDADGKTVMAPHYPPVVPEQTVAIGMSSTKCSRAFSGRTRFIQVSTDATCSIASAVISSPSFRIHRGRW